MSQQHVKIFIAYATFTKRFNQTSHCLKSHPDAIGAQLQHLQVCEVIQVGNAAYFVVKQKKFLQPSQLLQTLHLPQNVEGHIELPVHQTNFLIRINCT